MRYNPYTECVDVLTNGTKIANLVSELKGDLCIVRNALQKVTDEDDKIHVHDLTEIIDKIEDDSMEIKREKQ